MYTFQNATLLEITCHGSLNVKTFLPVIEEVILRIVTMEQTIAFKAGES